MARDYANISKLGWTCVQGTLGILCSRNKRPCDSVSLHKNEILIVDAISCKTKDISEDLNIVEPEIQEMITGVGDGTGEFVIQSVDGTDLFVVTNAGEIEMYGNLTVGELINGKFNWTTGDNYNSFDGYVLTFNETKLSDINGNVNSTSWDRTGTDVILANIGDSVGIGDATPDLTLEQLEQLLRDILEFLQQKQIMEIYL